MYHLMRRVYRDGGTKGKFPRAGASNGMFTGTYSNQRRPPSRGPAQHFQGTYMYHFVVVSLLRDEGHLRARRRRQLDIPRHIFQSSSTACWCTGPALWWHIYMYHVMVHLYYN